MIETKFFEIDEGIILPAKEVKDRLLGLGGVDKNGKFFADNGYQILAPKKLTTSQQIYYMSKCKEFACIEGSAAHNIVFAKPESKQYIIGKRCWNNLRQPIINQMMSILPMYISAFATRKYDDGFYGPFLMVINSDLQKFAQEHDMRIGRNTITALINRCKYYWFSYLQQLLEHFLKQDES